MKLSRALLLVWAVLAPFAAPAHAGDPTRPNILWITAEDIGPHLACYGDDTVATPNLDALAARSYVFDRAWSNAPVCAPARTAILTGMHPPSLGALDMRTMVPLPDHVRPFPELLREAGYYCTNRSKTDYNVVVGKDVWDASSGKAHWRNRAEGQPFFSVFNFTVTHESQIRNRDRALTVDPDDVTVPPYHPDDPVVREDWARYYSRIGDLDAQLGQVLAELEADGLADDTIVLFFGDHGSGMPRSKREPYDSGLRVPMTIHVPERFAHLAPADYTQGERGARLVSFVDLAPTMLSLVGIEPPTHLHGHAFAGEFEASAPEFLYGYRGRMDERVDLSRVVCDGRWLYRRNYVPDRPYGQYIDYQFQTPTTRLWYERFLHGGLDEVQAAFWLPKPNEELYDLAADPHETRNLADTHPEVAERLHVALRRFALEIRDVGFVPEPARLRRAGEESPWDLGKRLADEDRLAEILAAAAGATSLLAEDPVDRAWAVLRRRARGQSVPPELLTDGDPCVRVHAAELLATRGDADEREAALDVLLAAADIRRDPMLAVQALGALDACGTRAIGRRDAIAALPRSAEGLNSRLRNYVPRLLEHIEAGFAKFDGDGRPERETRVHTRLGDVELRLFVERPAGAPPPGGWPAVVFFHGGGWNSGTPEQFFPYTTALAERDVVGISAEYRLGKVHGTTPFDCVADGRRAVDWVRDHAHELGVDPRRLAAGGGSAGGHVAAAVACWPGDARPEALLLFNPVIDNGPEGYGHERLGERWKELSPLHNVEEGFPPTLFLLGTRDDLIPVETGRAFAERVESVGSRCELVLYEGAAHGFFNPGRGDHHADTVARMLKFLADLGWVDE